MAEINETPETPGGEPGAEQLAGTTPPTGAEQPASAEPPASAEQPVSSEPAASPQQPATAESSATAVPPVNAQPTEMSKEVNKDARMWAMFCHLIGLAALLPIIPLFGGAIGALIIWQIKKDDFPFVDEQGKEALNFQISILIYIIVGGILLFCVVGAFLIPAVLIFDIVFLVIAAIKSNNGFHYRYPLCIRFLK
jgi:uncharacterized Tic20 family protein